MPLPLFLLAARHNQGSGREGDLPDCSAPDEFHASLSLGAGITDEITEDEEDWNNSSR